MATFAYTEGDINRITSALRGAREFLTNESERGIAHKLERDLKRKISWELHINTLGEYLRQKRIPRGLRVRLHPTLCRDNVEHRTIWYKILNKCSVDLMVLTIESLQKELTKLIKEIAATEQELAAVTASTDLETLKKQIEDKLKEYQRETEEFKKKKFHRDELDYQRDQVYTWYSTADNRSYRPNRDTTTQRWRSDTEGATSSSSASSSSGMTFLERGTRHEEASGGGVTTRGTREKRQGRPPQSRRNL
ncbi:Hypothetical predicted protein [Pelobates cultripes]|uniref:Uncharacterized protein n=1 Tax=Pelobates cultripes TaxID=61616 RepID=A0AAD1T810_PELCU|nr:Hypothetical predicted protein [Pelobates cultripes]